MSADMNLDILGKHGCSLRDAPSILCLRHFDSVNSQTSAPKLNNSWLENASDVPKKEKLAG